MEFANDKDILRASTLGQHKGATHSSVIEIARGKARTEAAAIRDRRKILGRLEAMDDKWKDFEISEPFIKQCIALWEDDPQYVEAKNKGKNLGIYLKVMRSAYGLSYDFLLKKATLTTKTGKIFGTPDTYSYNSVGILIFNTYLKKFSRW